MPLSYSERLARLAVLASAWVLASVLGSALASVLAIRHNPGT